MNGYQIEATAKALHKAGIRCSPNIVHCRASHVGHAQQLLAAYQELGWEPTLIGRPMTTMSKPVMTNAIAGPQTGRGVRP